MLEADDRRLLPAAALEGRAGYAAWCAWREAGGSVENVRQSSFCLLPLIYRNLESGGYGDPDLPVLAGVYRYAFVSRERLLTPVAAALDALEAEGAKTMVLGGAAVGAVHYLDAACRPLDGVDVLADEADVASVLSVLRAGGWQERDPDPLRLTHAEGGTLVLRSRFPALGGDDGSVWRRAVATRLGGVAALAPDATDQLLHACAQASSPGAAVLQPLADAAVILRSAGDRIAWARFVTAVIESGASAGVVPLLELLRDHAGATVPSGVLTDLKAVRRRPRERLRSWSARLGGSRPRR